MQVTNEEWITRAKKKFPQFDYSVTNYEHCRVKVSVMCPVHGIFLQRPDSFMAGNTCQKCGRASSAEKHLLTYSGFVERSRKIFGNKYTYSETEFDGSGGQTTISCPFHGAFKKKVMDHINRKRGCSKCANRVRKTTEEYIQEARKVHGDDNYDYSLVNYTNNKGKIEIVCPNHGSFMQIAKSHLKGHDCPKCAISFSTSKGEQRWLDEHNVAKRNVGVRCGRSKINVDGFDPDTNIVYLYHGDFWHGNPKYYVASDLNRRARKTFGELYERTLTTEQRLRDAGYQIISIWESGWFDELRLRGEKPPLWYRAT